MPAGLAAAVMTQTLPPLPAPASASAPPPPLRGGCTAPAAASLGARGSDPGTPSTPCGASADVPGGCEPALAAWSSTGDEPAPAKADDIAPAERPPPDVVAHTAAANAAHDGAVFPAGDGGGAASLALAPAGAALLRGLPPASPRRPPSSPAAAAAEVAGGSQWGRLNGAAAAADRSEPATPPAAAALAPAGLGAAGAAASVGPGPVLQRDGDDTMPLARRKTRLCPHVRTEHDRWAHSTRPTHRAGRAGAAEPRTSAVGRHRPVAAPALASLAPAPTHPRAACPFYHHGGADRRRPLERFTYSSNMCPAAAAGRECASGDMCPMVSGRMGRGLARVWNGRWQAGARLLVNPRFVVSGCSALLLTPAGCTPL
jgi:hypothetical protein